MSTRRTHAVLATLTLGTALLLSGCGGSSSSTTAGGSGASMSMSPGASMSMSTSPGGSMSGDAITIEDFAFSGGTTVAPGSTVTVTNHDSETHSVTADGAGGFDVTVPAGGSTTFTAPSKAGSYPYHCMFHSDMHGMLRVR